MCVCVCVYVYIYIYIYHRGLEERKRQQSVYTYLLRNFALTESKAWYLVECDIKLDRFFTVINIA